MLPQHVLVALIAAHTASSVPLNINLGAYSPALVVGDGEITIGDAENARGIIETLQTATKGADGTGELGEGALPPAVDAAAASSASTQSATTPADPQANAAAQDSPNGSGSGTKITDSNDQAVPSPDASASKRVVKRDIVGFREALNYAKEAMKNTPEINLGTHESGVGILQRPGVNVEGGTPSAGISSVGGEKGDAGTLANGPASGAAVKREDGAGLERRGVTLLAIAEI